MGTVNEPARRHRRARLAKLGNNHFSDDGGVAVFKETSNETFLTEVHGLPEDVVDYWSKEDAAKEAARARIYRLLLERIQFSSSRYTYEGYPVSPLFQFFEIFQDNIEPPVGGEIPSSKKRRKKPGTKTQSRSSAVERSQELRIWIPDTIIFTSLDDNGSATRFVHLFSSNEGVVQCYSGRLEDFQYLTVLKRFGVRKHMPEDAPAAILKKPSRQSRLQNDVNLLGPSDFFLLLSGDFSQIKGKFCLQRYIKCRGPKASLIRAVWRKGKPAYGWAISNKRGFTTWDSKDETAVKWRTSTELTDSCTIVHLTGRACVELEDMLETFVKHMEIHTLLARCYRFDELVADFVRDDKGVPYMVQVKAFRLKELYGPRSQSVPPAAQRATDSDDDLHSLPPTVQMESRARKVYKRNERCHSCNAKYEVHELPSKMTMKMILQTQRHLRSRGVYLRCFEERSETRMRTIARQASSKYEWHKVCKNCYDLYHAEMQLADMELDFAHAIGIPINNPNSRHQVPFAQGPSGDEGQPSPHDLTTVTHERFLPPQLTTYRLMVFVHGLYEVSDEFEHWRQYYLEYTVLGDTVAIPLDVVRHARTLPLNRIRVYYLFADDENLKTFIRQRQKMDLHIYAAPRELMGSTALALNYRLDDVEKNDCYQPLASPLGPTHCPCDVKVSIGFARGAAVSTSSLSLRFHKGVYLPSNTHYTCDPLPDSWMAMLPHDQLALAASSAAGVLYEHPERRDKHMDLSPLASVAMAKDKGLLPTMQPRSSIAHPLDEFLSSSRRPRPRPTARPAPANKPLPRSSRQPLSSVPAQHASARGTRMHAAVPQSHSMRTARERLPYIRPAWEDEPQHHPPRQQHQRNGGHTHTSAPLQREFATQTQSPGSSPSSSPSRHHSQGESSGSNDEPPPRERHTESWAKGSPSRSPSPRSASAHNQAASHQTTRPQDSWRSRQQHRATEDRARAAPRGPDTGGGGGGGDRGTKQSSRQQAHYMDAPDRVSAKQHLRSRSFPRAGDR